VTELLGRKPFLWDNYPVNDGAIKANHLHLRAVNQEHSELQNHIAGHALNPMNQAYLSQISLASLPIAYAQGTAYNPQHTFTEVVKKLCGDDLASLIFKDITMLQDKGLKNLTQDEKNMLLNHYKQLPQNNMCDEIIGWLKGEYSFDPACLTE
jgi:hypothetical protein